MSGGRIRSLPSIIAILAVMNLINYADRFLLSPLTPLLEQSDQAGGLGLSEFQIGLLGTAFMVVHSLASVPLGILADKFRRKYLISIGVALWSLATATAGLARTYGQIFLARASVGIGEATYAPAASAMISDKFKPELRARALAIFQLGMVVGGGFGIVVGGIVAQHFGWRGAFFVFGLPGLAIAALCLLIHEPERPSATREARPSDSLAMQAGALFRSPALVWINVTGIFITFTVGALTFWAPKFILDYHYAGSTDALATVTTAFGSVALPMAAIGAVTGSFIADRVEKRRPREGRLLAIAIGSLAALPFAVVGYFAEAMILVYAALGLASFFMSWYVGPILAVLHDVVPREKRGVATGAYFLLVHLLGDAISPAIVGAISGRTGSLRLGLLCATGTLALGGMSALVAIQRRKRAARPAT